MKIIVMMKCVDRENINTVKRNLKKIMGLCVHDDVHRSCKTSLSIEMTTDACIIRGLMGKIFQLRSRFR